MYDSDAGAHHRYRKATTIGGELFRFDQRQWFHGVLQSYPPAMLLSPRLSALASSGNLDLEQALREDASSDDPRERRAFYYLIPYLHDVIATCNAGFTTHPACYVQLVRHFTRNAGQVAFVSLNYDCLLERALELVDVRYATFDDYVPDTGPILIKPHGSVNWYSRIGTRTEFKSWYAAVDNLAGGRRLASAPIVERRPLASARGAEDETSWRFPAITAPIAGKSAADFVCPPSHVDRLRTFMNDCHHLVFIGTSGHDVHVLRLLQRRWPPEATVHVVDKGLEHARSAADRIGAAIGYNPHHIRVYGDGFSTYVHPTGPIGTLFRN